MIGTFELLIIDCPDPQQLARFYAELVRAEIIGSDIDWAEIAPPVGGRPIIAFQQVEHSTAPRWPDQTTPQHMHLDVRVEDFDVAEAAVLELGATKAGSETPTFRVYLDPAGHPFCLINPQD